MDKIINKIKKYIIHPELILLKLDRYKIIHLSDIFFLKLQYYNVFEKKLDLNNPGTFNEKLQWLKLNDRKKIYTSLVDKILVKDYISKKIGDKYIIPTIEIYNNFDEINFEALPSRFVIKCNHYGGSKGIYICNDKNKICKKQLKKEFERILKKNLYYYSREWPYKNVKPKILIEKYMGKSLNDYKFFCFNGKVQTILVCSNRDGNYKNTDFYDKNWNLMPFTRKNHENNPKGIKKPEKLGEMIKIAEKLSENIPFVRVDLYEISKKIYFGELTFFPSGGLEGFKPREWDKKLGDILQLPQEKSV